MNSCQMAFRGIKNKNKKKRHKKSFTNLVTLHLQQLLNFTKTAHNPTNFSKVKGVQEGQEDYLSHCIFQRERATSTCCE